jgi:3-oxoacyl-[acyl-carrier protein] reductase
VVGKIEGKRVLVTGGTRGIGLAITEALLERGARVLLCGRQIDTVSAVLAELQEKYGTSVAGRACDVGDYEAVRDLFVEADRLMSGIDILINNAGVGTFRTVEEMSIEEWSKTIATNLTGVFYCCHEAISRMKGQGGGDIINIGSLAGKEAFAGAAAYCASKFGLVGFSEALMQEVRQDHIKVSHIMPGSVNTGFGRGGEQDPQMTWKLWPRDVAEVVVNLLNMDRRALPSRIELRPSEPKN